MVSRSGLQIMARTAAKAQNMQHQQLGEQAEVAKYLQELNQILQNSLQKDQMVQFSALYKQELFPEFIPPESSSTPDNPYPRSDQFFEEKTLTFAERFFGVGRKERQAQEQASRIKYEAALEKFEEIQAVIQGVQDMDAGHAQASLEVYELQKAAFEKSQHEFNDKIDLFKAGYMAQEQDPVESYNAMILERSVYPQGFPQQFELFYHKESRELVVQYEVPALSVIPEYKAAELQGSASPMRERVELYTHLVASMALRSLQEIFVGDQADAIASVVWNGYVKTADAELCLLAIRATKAEFLQGSWNQDEAVAGVQALQARLSPAMDELIPVEPMVLELPAQG